MRALAPMRIRAAMGVLACLAIAATARAQQNLSFELGADSGAPLGWRIGGGERSLRAAADSRWARDGSRSLRIAGDDGLTRVTQRIPIERAAGNANRVALRGFVRAPSGDDSASLWLRVDGPGGFLAVDSRGAIAPSDSAGWKQHEIQLPVPDDARELTVGAVVRGGATAWFDGLEIDWIDAQDLPPPSATARRYVEGALDLMQQHSINRRAIDWPAFRAAALEQARGAVTTTDAHLAVRFALRNLGDHHSYLVAQSTAAALSVTPVSNARTGRAAVAPRAEQVGEFGYLALPGFAGGTPAAQVAFANEVQSLIEDLDSKGPRGFILDLRRNSGGNLWPMLAGIGPLLGPGEAGASVYPDGSERAFWYDEGKAGFGDYVQLRVSRDPYELRHPAAPIAVLVGSGTASSAEVLALALRARGNAVIVGEPTRGLAPGNRTFALPDGAALVLTVAATRDRAGRIYQGPISPDIPTRDEPVSEDASETALGAAVAWLRERAAASGY